MSVSRIRVLNNKIWNRMLSPFASKIRCSNEMADNYEEAINRINALQSNAAYIKNANKSGIIPHSETYSTTIAQTQKYLLRTGISLEQLDKLSVIHVAGTKGKGSTCAFCESILRHHGYKTGFYSSPHLVAMRERIKINGKPMSKERFAENVFKVYNQLTDKRNDPEDLPGYFRFLTVLAFNIFIEEKVDVAVIEVGIGGEYDCTNVVRNTPVVGITSLGIDHVSLLGNTIEQIAWQKGGIMKKNSKVFTVKQPNSAIDVLKQRSIERQCSLTEVPAFDSYFFHDNKKPILGINGDVQEINASLAIQLAHNWIKYCGRIHKINHARNIGTQNLGTCNSTELENNLIVPKNTNIGLEKCKWPGRNQILETPGCTFYLDGAHTTDSIEFCAHWFKTTATKSSNGYKAMIFNVTGPRNSEELLEKLVLLDLDRVIFVPNVANDVPIADQITMQSTEDEQLKKCENHKRIWLKLREKKINEGSQLKHQVVSVFPSVAHAVNNLPKNLHGDILITGSLHLVGAALSVLDPELRSF